MTVPFPLVVETFADDPLGPFANAGWSVVSAPTITEVNGARSLAWDRNAMLLRGGLYDPFYTAQVLRVDYGGAVLTSRNAAADFVGGTLTSDYFVWGVYKPIDRSFGLVVTEDGAIHLCYKSAFQYSANGNNAEVLASSAAGVLPIGDYCLLECWAEYRGIFPSMLHVYVNGTEVLTWTKVGMDPFIGDLGIFMIGGGVPGGFPDEVGWRGRMSYFALWENVEAGAFPGTILTERLDVSGDATPQESMRGGAEIQPTRWQSVNALVGGDNYVSFATPTDTPLADHYAMDNMAATSQPLVALDVQAFANAAPSGVAVGRAGAATADGVTMGVEAFVYPTATNSVTTLRTILPTQPNGAPWTISAVNAARLVVQRDG